MNTTNTPPAKPEKAADTKDTAKPAKPAKADLAPAGQSGDPDVQRLLANREAHRLAIADIDQQLEALGVIAG